MSIFKYLIGLRVATSCAEYGHVQSHHLPEEKSRSLTHCIILSFQIHLSKRHGSRAERDSALPRGVPALGTDSRHQVEEGEHQIVQVQLQHAQGLPLHPAQPAQQVHVEAQCR